MEELKSEILKHDHSRGEEYCPSCGVEVELHENFWQQKELKTIGISLLLLAIGLYLEFIVHQNLIAQIFFLGTALLSGKNILLNALNALKKVRFDMNVLMATAATGAFLIGHGEEGASVLFLFFIAEFLEEYAAAKSKQSIKSLLGLAPSQAIVIRNGKEMIVAVHDIKIEEIFIVKPGDKVALDGIIVKGSASIDEATITGESVPKFKQVNDLVFAGTFNSDGYIEVKVTKEENQTMLAKIKKLVEEAEKQKSSSELFVEKFAKYYTPLVLLVALAIATIPTLFFSQPFEEWIYRSLTLLVIACPCALAISTPVTMVSGLTAAARSGVLIKGGRHLENIAKIKYFAFDKTGTLTTGKITVEEIFPLNGFTEKQILSIAAGLEKMSNHPIAKAIVIHASDKKIDFDGASNFSSITGKGVKGTIRKTHYFAGQPSFLKEQAIQFPEEQVRKIQSEGKITILVSDKEKAIGIISLADQVKENATQTIQELKELGIEPIMLTGDNEHTAKAIVQKVGITHFHAQLSPEDKVNEIKHYVEKEGNIAMVGDGVNDAPALAQATVGIAMGAMGSAIAIETADISILKDDLQKIVELIKLSRKTSTKIKQNIIASILVKSSLGFGSIIGIVPLWVAVAIGDMGLSIAVILNALSINKK